MGREEGGVREVVKRYGRREGREGGTERGRE